jgi:hypothetical protein
MIHEMKVLKFCRRKEVLIERSGSMKRVYSRGLFVLISLISFSLVSGRVVAQGNYGGDYNATERSPTLPLHQTPPPENSPSSVTVGAPNYYYYYPNMGGYGGSPYYNSPQAGAVFSNVGGQNRRTFWVTTPIPGQVAPWGGGPGMFGPNFFGPGFVPGGNNIFIP